MSIAAPSVPSTTASGKPMRSKRARTWSPLRSIDHTADLLRLAVGLATADGGLLRRHRHEQRVLAFDAPVPSPHAEPAGAEDRDARAHVDRGEPDPGPRFRRLERRRQHRADRVGVGLPDDRHRGRPDLRGGRFDLAVALLIGWTGAVSNRHDRESSTAHRSGDRGRESCERSTKRSRSSPAVRTASVSRWEGTSPSTACRSCSPTSNPDRSTTRSRTCAARGSTSRGCVTDVTKLASVDHLADETLRAFGAVHVRVQQRRHRPGRSDHVVGLRGERLALVPRRQRLRCGMGYQGVRAAHDPRRRRRPHRQYVVGERRDRADGRRADLRDVEERGDDAHRTALLPTARPRTRSSRARCCIPGRTGCGPGCGRRGGPDRRSTRSRSSAPPRTRASRSSSSRWKRPERRCR